VLVLSSADVDALVVGISPDELAELMGVVFGCVSETSGVDTMPQRLSIQTKSDHVTRNAHQAHPGPANATSSLASGSPRRSPRSSPRRSRVGRQLGSLTRNDDRPDVTRSPISSLATNHECRLYAFAHFPLCATPLLPPANPIYDSARITLLTPIPQPSAHRTATSFADQRPIASIRAPNASAQTTNHRIQP